MFWRVYQWLWLRAQKAAAKEIIAYGAGFFREPEPEWSVSKDPVKLRQFHQMMYARIEALKFLEMVSQEFEVNREPKGLNLLRFREQDNNFDKKLRSKE